MTAIHFPGLQPLLAQSRVGQMPENDDEAWRRQYYQQHHQIPVTAPHWPDARSVELSSAQASGLGMFLPTHAEYHQPYGNSTAQLLPPRIGFAPEGPWPQDVDMNTPSTTGFSNDTMDGYRNLYPPGHQHLSLPTAQHDRISSRAHSPPSSHDDPSPHQAYLHAPDHREVRPGLGRSTTAPDNIHHMTAQTLARPGSDDEEDECITAGDLKPRSGPGKKRQRIPHTAVERRYRENLNAHLERLRQNVPSLVSKRAAGASRPGDGLGEGVKPSKCEILTGAIEHITDLGKENAALMGEVKALRTRMEDMERWYGPQSRGFAK